MSKGKGPEHDWKDQDMTASKYPFYFISNREDRDGGPESTQEAAARAFEIAATEAYEDPRDWRPCTLTIEQGIDVYGGAISTELLYINTSDMSSEMFGDDGDNDNSLHWLIVEDGDPDIIEELHSECAPCSAVYYAARYAMAHYDKYGEPYKPLLMY